MYNNFTTNGSHNWARQQGLYTSEFNDLELGDCLEVHETSFYQ